MRITPSRQFAAAAIVSAYSFLLPVTALPARAGGDQRNSGGSLRRDGRFEITSPDTAQTYVDGNTTRYVLLWDERRSEFLAAITFSNSPYVGWQRVRREENFNFRLPGVTLDPVTGVFSARDARGQAIPVAARQRGGLENGNIRPTPGTTIRVVKPDGLVRVHLTATPGSPALVRSNQQGRWLIDGVVSPL